MKTIYLFKVITVIFILGVVGCSTEPTKMNVPKAGGDPSKTEEKSPINREPIVLPDNRPPQIIPPVLPPPVDDVDRDGILNDVDNCPQIANHSQRNMDHDEFGDICDDDIDGDLIVNREDPCPENWNQNCQGDGGGGDDGRDGGPGGDDGRNLCSRENVYIARAEPAVDAQGNRVNEFNMDVLNATLGGLKPEQWPEGVQVCMNALLNNGLLSEEDLQNGAGISLVTKIVFAAGGDGRQPLFTSAEQGTAESFAESCSRILILQKEDVERPCDEGPRWAGGDVQDNARILEVMGMFETMKHFDALSEILLFQFQTVMINDFEGTFEPFVQFFGIGALQEAMDNLCHVFTAEQYQSLVDRYHLQYNNECFYDAQVGVQSCNCVTLQAMPLGFNPNAQRILQPITGLNDRDYNNFMNNLPGVIPRCVMPNEGWAIDQIGGVSYKVDRVNVLNECPRQPPKPKAYRLTLGTVRNDVPLPPQFNVLEGVAQVVSYLTRWDRVTARNFINDDNSARVLPGCYTDGDVNLLMTVTENSSLVELETGADLCRDVRERVNNRALDSVYKIVLTAMRVMGERELGQFKQALVQLTGTPVNEVNQKVDELRNNQKAVEFSRCVPVDMAIRLVNMADQVGVQVVYRQASRADCGL